MPEAGNVTMVERKKNWFARHKVTTVILAFVLLMIIISASKGSTGTTPAATSSSVQPTSQTTPAPVKWDVETAYAKISNGMTKSQVEEATGKKSDNCTESTSEYVGKTESCSYGNAFIDKGSIMVIYSQDAVSSKTKSTY
jgi:hypothetical protein